MLDEQMSFAHKLRLLALSVSLATVSCAFSAEDAKPPTEKNAATPEFPAAQIEFFEEEIRPLLADNCLECHTGTKAKVGLMLDRRAGWLKGSDYRKVVDLEKPAESVLIKSVSHTGGKDIPSMPEDLPKISDESIAKLTKWIGMGLPWPEYDKPAEADPKQHWSFQPVKKPELPENAGHPIDYFLSKSQKALGVTPAPKADRQTLYRRVHFDLLGLPPKFEESQKFINDPRPDNVVWPELIEHLMGSQHYGERWARHWMDIARYSDTKGYEAGGRERRFVYSYTYRDWLIKAFNEDIPYDKFLLYQLAGEQLVDWEGPDKRHLAALGFLSLSKNGKQELVLDDRLDTTFRGTMALTVSCARCHDHKFDPISTKEYYSLYGVFLNSMTEDQPTIGDAPKGPEYDKYLKELAEKQKVVDEFLEPKLEKIAKENPNIANRRAQLIGKLERPDRIKLRNLERVVDKFVADSKMEADKALVLKDRESNINQHVFIRGNPSRRGELAPRQFLEIASLSEEPTEYEKGSGRLEMAQDIVDPTNPLTARNIVNRIWMWHFGEGIVRSVDDFGTQGEKPDHPELLDYLATWFVENGWSVKKLHKLILTSKAWQQQSSNPNEEANMLVDAENRLLWKYNRQRLDLEQMRDGMLDVVGNLDNTMYGRAVKILEPPYSNRRSVYAFIDRQNLPPIFRNFDFSNPSETTAQRPNTTIPMQALFTLNSNFVQNQATNLAKKTESAEDRIKAMHRAVFAKEPSESDRHMAESFLTVFNSEMGDFAERQTETEWSYGWGAVDDAGKVDFKPFPHWTGERWQMSEQWPYEHNLYRYLRADDRGFMHPGATESESAMYQWRAPADLKIQVESVAERSAVGKGNGVRLRVATSSEGVIFDKVLEASQKTLPVNIPQISIKRGEFVWFILDANGNTSHDSTKWDPKIVDLDGNFPAWQESEMFSGPAKPATAWSAYAHALLNTNRFLFVE
ncbi:MAG: hypothetical protein CMO55_10390 [Verrucomicrobiales bacterium]|nr:hypothetical protein [Verrucomicrobiales bacterium]